MAKLLASKMPVTYRRCILYLFIVNTCVNTVFVHVNKGPVTMHDAAPTAAGSQRSITQRHARVLHRYTKSTQLCAGVCTDACCPSTSIEWPNRPTHNLRTTITASASHIPVIHIYVPNVLVTRPPWPLHRPTLQRPPAVYCLCCCLCLCRLSLALHHAPSAPRPAAAAAVAAVALLQPPCIPQRCAGVAAVLDCAHTPAGPTTTPATPECL
jgi:hypothetical protein